MPPFKVIGRLIAVSIMWISGPLAILKDFYFSYLATKGNPVPPSGTLQVLGHLSTAAFVISGLTAWCFEYRRAAELERRLVRPGQEHVAEVARFLAQGIQIQNNAPNGAAHAEQIAAWREALTTWTNETNDFLHARSVQASIRFVDTSGMSARNFYLLHSDIQRELNVLDRQISNLTQIIEKPETYLV